MIFQTSMIMFHVNLPGCIILVAAVILGGGEHPKLVQHPETSTNALQASGCTAFSFLRGLSWSTGCTVVGWLVFLRMEKHMLRLIEWLTKCYLRIGESEKTSSKIMKYMYTWVMINLFERLSTIFGLVWNPEPPSLNDYYGYLAPHGHQDFDLGSMLPSLGVLHQKLEQQFLASGWYI